MEHAVQPGTEQADFVTVNEFVTINEIATRVRVSKMTVYRLIQSGALPAVQIGRCFRVRRGDLDEYLGNARVSVNAR